jgi:hypothetical protein
VLDLDRPKLHTFTTPVTATSPARATVLPGLAGQLVATGAHLLVTIRDLPEGGGALLVLRRAASGELAEERRIALPADAWGLGLTKDEGRVLVTSAWTAKASLVDWRAGSVIATVDLAREPRGVTVLDDGVAFVSHLVGRDVTKLTGLDRGALEVERVQLLAAPARSAIGDEPSASLGYAVVPSADGKRVFFPRHSLGSLGEEAWFGGPTVDVLGLASGGNIGPRRRGTTEFFTESDGVSLANFWSAGSKVLESGRSSFVQPRAALLRRSASSLLVASEGSDLVVELDALMSDPVVAPLRTYDLGREEEARPTVRPSSCSSRASNRTPRYRVAR